MDNRKTSTDHLLILHLTFSGHFATKWSGQHARNLQLRRVLGAKDTISVLTCFWQNYRTAGSAQLLQFGLTDLNLILNKKLNRPADHPTFGRMVEYALRDVISKDRIITITI